METRAAYETQVFYSVITENDGRDGSVGTATRYGLNGPGFVTGGGGGGGGRFYGHIQTGLSTSGKAGRSRRWPPVAFLAPRLGMGGATPLHPHSACLACYGGNLYL